MIRRGSRLHLTQKNERPALRARAGKLIVVSSESVNRKAEQVTPVLIEAVRRAAEDEHREWHRVKRGKARQAPLYGFCRSLRRCAEFDDLNEKAALSKVCAAARQIGTTLDELFPQSEDAAMAFLRAWIASSFCGSFGRAVRDADSEPEPIQHQASAKYTRFIRICKHLQRRGGDRPFILSLKVFAKVLKVSERMVTNYKRQGEDEGLLQLITPADHSDRHAARYRYIGLQ